MCHIGGWKVGESGFGLSSAFMRPISDLCIPPTVEICESLIVPLLMETTGAGLYAPVFTEIKEDGLACSPALCPHE